MLVLIVSFSVAAALLYAWAVVIQRYEAGQVEPEELFRKDLIKKLSKNPKWLGAFGLQALAFFFQAAALRDGSLILVQPILTIDLVFLLLILHFHKHVPMGKREWVSILMICLGLSGALIFANPSASKGPYSMPKLILAILIVSVIILVGISIVRRAKSSHHRALISAIAAGLSFTLLDVFAKIVSKQVSEGFVFLVSHWQVWALCASGIVSIIMTQNTYSSGPVAVSQPTMEIVEPVAGVALGIFIFGDTVNLSSGNLVAALLFGAIACSGIIILSRSKRLQAHKL